MYPHRRTSPDAPRADPGDRGSARERLGNPASSRERGSRDGGPDPMLAIDFQQGLTDAWDSIATFLPKLVGFLLILLVGYIVAKVLASIVDRLLERVGFDRWVE